jgi:hypothetical protein
MIERNAGRAVHRGKRWRFISDLGGSRVEFSLIK